jgi:hypothetical protein
MGVQGGSSRLFDIQDIVSVGGAFALDEQNIAIKAQTSKSSDAARDVQDPKESWVRLPGRPDV